MRAWLGCGAALAAIMLCAGAAHADSLLYSFETTNVAGPDGFFGLGATVTQDTIGATEGTKSMKYQVDAAQTFVGARTETVIPAPLGNPPGIVNILFDMNLPATYGGAFADIGVTVFGHQLNHSPQTFGNQVQFGGAQGFVAVEGRAPGQYNNLSITLNLSQGSFGAGQSFNQIFGPGVDQLTVASAFQLYLSKSGDAPLTVYIDNVRVGQVPEPATWGLLCIGCTAMGAFRRRNRG